ncbi:hypothetical protein ACFL2K_00440 [Candidatus Margulisiibacteriota bacterium]
MNKHLNTIHENNLINYSSKIFKKISDEIDSGKSLEEIRRTASEIPKERRIICSQLIAHNRYLDALSIAEDISDNEIREFALLGILCTAKHNKKLTPSLKGKILSDLSLELREVYANL